MDKQKALKHFITLGYDAEIKDGILYVNYDSSHDPEAFCEFVDKEIQKIGYRTSYGIKSRKDKSKMPLTMAEKPNIETIQDDMEE